MRPSAVPSPRRSPNGVRGSVRIFNEYGPTEAVVGCMITSATPTSTWARVPIGHAPGCRTPRVDARRHTPVGAWGELYISDQGSEGYLDRPTQASSASHVRSSAAALLYRTGDLVRLEPTARVRVGSTIRSRSAVSGWSQARSKRRSMPPVVTCAAVACGRPTARVQHCVRCGLGPTCRASRSTMAVFAVLVRGRRTAGRAWFRISSDLDCQRDEQGLGARGSTTPSTC